MEHSLQTILSIENVRVKAHHGWYPAERKIGGMYSISVFIYKYTHAAESYIEIADTINYESIHAIILEEMKVEYTLIEHCTKSLWDKLKVLQEESIWEVKLVKEDVPIKFVGQTSFTIKG
jgi:dihydroneopterin aldolase